MFGWGVEAAAKGLEVSPEAFLVLVDGDDESDGIVVGEFLLGEDGERNWGSVAAVGGVVVAEEVADSGAVIVRLNDTLRTAPVPIIPVAVIALLGLIQHLIATYNLAGLVDAGG